MHRLHAPTLLATLLLATAARADEAPSPSMFVCEGKKVGDACTSESGPGTCVQSTCSRLDYSRGTPPTTVSRDCLQCQKSAPPPTPPKPEPEPAATTPPPAPKASSSCRVDDNGGAGLLLLLALTAFRRRRALRRPSA